MTIWATWGPDDEAIAHGNYQDTDVSEYFRLVYDRSAGTTYLYARQPGTYVDMCILDPYVSQSTTFTSANTFPILIPTGTATPYSHSHVCKVY